MSEDADEQETEEEGGRTLAQQEGREALTPWLGWFLAPSAWALHQGIGYAMVPWLCATGRTWPYHALTAVAVTLCGLGALSSLLALRRSRRIHPRHSEERMRMMALVGLMFSGAALGGIVVEYAGSFWIDVCAGV